jgi:hypothetical protein
MQPLFPAGRGACVPDMLVDQGKCGVNACVVLGLDSTQDRFRELTL